MTAQKADLLGSQKSSAGTATTIVKHGSRLKNDSTDRTDLETMLPHGAGPCPFGRFDSIFSMLAHILGWMIDCEHDITVSLQRNAVSCLFR